MDCKYVPRMMHRVPTPSPSPLPPPDYKRLERTVHAIQYHQANIVVPTHVSATIEALNAPTPPLPDSVYPPHCEWDNLVMLGFPAITNLIDLLTKRCAVARIALHEALTNFEFSTHTLLAETSYNQLVEDVPAYLGVFRNAIVVSRTIFPAQEAYRSALTTLGMLITDLVDVLPEKCAVKKSMKEKLEPGLKKADKAEQGVRTLLGALADPANKGRETYGLMVYMNTVRERFENWGVEEARFRVWAGECIGALL